MLIRRRLLFMFTPLVALLVVTAVVAVLLLEDVLHRMSNPTAHDWSDHVALAARFRWVLLGISLAFLVLVNACAFVLIRTAGMVLGPVERLVKASREIAGGRFEHRVELEHGKDEFAELASAYNQMAEALKANERRRVETLGLAALTLNHELNNAMGIIEMQLQLLSRRAADPAAVEQCLQRIGGSLARMGAVVESLKHVKRIVLTDYVAGTRMLDLERSTTEPAAASDGDGLELTLPDVERPGARKVLR